MMDTLVICSGGIDSTVCLYREITHSINGDLKNNIHVVTFNYGQKAKKEKMALDRITKKLEITPHVIDVRPLMKAVSDSALTNTGEKVPTSGSRASTMNRTVVPGRNGMLIWSACMLASKLNCEKVVYGAHKNDEFMYIDCRPSFVMNMQDAIRAGFDQSIKLEAPLLYITKADVIRHGSQLGVPLDETWSCYNNKKLQCGECSSCEERKQAFSKANVIDRTEYLK